MQSNKAKLAVLILGQGLMLGQTNATISSKSVHIYAGLAGGLQNMSNKESQSVSFPNGAAAGTPTYIPFQNNVSQSSRNGLYSAFGGITWNIPMVHMFIGPEIYIGRSNSDIQKSVTVPEDVTLTNRSMQTTVRSSNYAGGTIQIGANLPMKFKAYRK
jgi:hypothetical protein